MSGDVVDLIMADHREVERLFDEMQRHPEKRPLLAPVLSALLTAHSRAEEAEVYPVARDEAQETKEVAHSQEEHEQAEELLVRMNATDPESPEFDTVLQELIDSVTHHVQEEESTVLPGMKTRLDDARRRELGEAFAVSRAEHLGDQPGQASRKELEMQARNMNMSGTSNMNKERLAKEVKKKASR
ncbi:hemerythrin domain-containing protein [Glycomyces terrestris]|uniref:Hemerythrin domain-containing protein n=1 Tax=Glycomyces terrestris TaxID=2493553 RepID=A0A426UV64_9ACTN|nr:hemerythrin domain-containing protein [Glycomyces terrestris]RRR98227.1 hemerythrin domain-containing protein [Glycomyces terrestris]